LASAEGAVAQREQAAAAEAEAKRKTELQALADHGDAAWEEVEELINVGQSKAYDQAVALSKNLHALAIEQDKVAVFECRVEHIRKQYSCRSSLMAANEKRTVGIILKNEVTNMTNELSTPYPLTDEQIATYQKDGYIKLKNVLSAETLAHYGAEISRAVQQKSKEALPLEERNTYSKAFLQLSNIWEDDEVVKEFVMSERLGQIAARLMQVDGVRMYHDQALFKEASGGFTPWHADQYYWPLSNDNTVTAWIPLQATPVEMGPLSFCIGSQQILSHRDVAISDESEQKLNRSLKDYPKDETPFDLGEVSFHAGWTFHRAGPNTTGQMRGVMTVIYIEDGITLAEPKNQNQQNDWNRWMPGAELGKVVDTPLNPVIWNVNH